MGYRNITVRGVECKYVIGRTHTKIQIPGGVSRAFPNEEVGRPVEKTIFNDITNEVESDGFYPIEVKPADVSRKIRGLI